MTRARKLRITLLIVLGLVLIAIALRATSSGPRIERDSTLVLQLAGSYVETQQPPLFSRLLGDSARPFVGLLSTLAFAERDDRLKTVVLRIRSLDIGWGKAQEIRNAIGRLRAAGRKVVAHLELAAFSANREYYVASAADEIYMPPGANLPVLGLAGEYLYFGGLWAKLGIEIEVARVGKYKSAVETFVGEGMSPASREMANSLLDSTYQQFVDGIAEGRGMTPDQVRAAIDAGPVLGEDLRELDLIDGIEHVRPLLDRLGGAVVEHSVYAQLDPTSVGFDPVAQVALIYGTGTVVMGKGSLSPRGNPVLASETVSKAFREAAKDSEIDAIIFRIDSPGGSSLASEVVWEALREARSSGKPIIASFSDVAASGGYYVAAGADEIVAPPGVLTGSIGVFALRPVLGGLLDKIGIQVEALTRGRHADFHLSAEPLSEGAGERLQSLVDDTYELFVERVAEGRSMDPKAVDEIAQGRVWTGAQAFELGLLDELGGLHVAVERVKSRLELTPDDDVVLRPYPEPRSLVEQLAEMLQGRVARFSRSRGELIDALAEAGIAEAGLLRRLEARLAELPLGSPLALAPLMVEIR